jgi:hypothetical protein
MSMRAMNVICAVAVIGFMSAPVFAVATADSTTWEGLYEADVLPDSAGWVVATGLEPNFTSLTGTGQIRMNNIGDPVNNIGWWQKFHSFDLNAGASVEWRAKVNDPASGPNSMAMNLQDDGTAGNTFIRMRLFGAAQMQLFVGASGAAQTVALDVSQFHTYRITSQAGAGNVKLYIDDNPVAAASGTLDGFGTAGGPSGIFMGDVTSSSTADWTIDYARWTNQGAFAAVPEPASIALALIGLPLVLRRKRN